VVFVFPDWRRPDNPGGAYCICWRDDEWVQYWYWLGRGDWDGDDRVLRRK
jgi:hypothetical protein